MQNDTSFTAPVRVAGTDSEALIAHAHARLNAALNQHANHIFEVTVRFRDINGPRGGVDKHCLAVIRLRSGRQPVVVEETGEDAYHVVSHLATRVKQSVGRVLGKQRMRIAPPRDFYYRRAG